MIQVTIPDDAVYDSEGLQQLLDLRPSALRHARQSGALKFSKAVKRCWYSGINVKAWLFSENGDAESSD